MIQIQWFRFIFADTLSKTNEIRQKRISQLVQKHFIATSI